jgi:hypothetical protein
MKVHGRVDVRTKEPPVLKVGPHGGSGRSVECHNLLPIPGTEGLAEEPYRHRGWDTDRRLAMQVGHTRAVGLLLILT